MNSLSVTNIQTPDPANIMYKLLRCDVWAHQ